MKTLVLVLLALVAPLVGRAAAGERDMVAETEIEHQLARIDAALVAPFRAARMAIDKGDYAESAKLLAPICERAPTFEPALRRLGSSLSRLGQRNEGLAWAEKAVALNRTSANLATLAYVLAFPGKGEPSRRDQERALALLLECRTLPGGNDAGTLTATAQVALQLGKHPEARTAITALERTFPDLMSTHYFAAVMAALDEKWGRAETEIRRAQQLGLDSGTVQRFLESGVQSRATAWRYIHWSSWAFGLWAFGLASLGGLGYALSRATLRQIARVDAAAVTIAPGERRLRQIYRAVLNVAGLYYYVSLPVVMALVVAAAASIFYGFVMVGWIPIKLTILLAIGALVTIWSMGRSLFLRVESNDPGRPLERDEADGLWRLTDEVAQTLGTRPIEEIRITPGTDLCVYERGSWREKMENRATRVLVLGTAVLNDFKQEDFRCVLAHEYGHFSNRDTAGGDVALRVQNDMVKFYLAMVQAGQASWLNIAFHFLRVYHFTFTRISHGATRLQEVLADRIAAQAYGAAAFEGGLRHVIRRSIEFNAKADFEISEALKAQRPIQSLYEGPPVPATWQEEAFEKEINRPTTPDDTHPAPHERFRLLARVPVPRSLAPAGMVWDLFADRSAVLREMMDAVEKNVAAHRTEALQPA